MSASGRRYITVSYEESICLNMILEAGMSEFTKQSRDPHMTSGQKALTRQARHTAANFRRRLKKLRFL